MRSILLLNQSTFNEEYDNDDECSWFSLVLNLVVKE